jgi:hypothetical protein
MKKVFIGIPSGDMVHTDFALSLVGIVSSPVKDVAISVFNAKSSMIAQNRNKIASYSLKAGATHTLMLDTDMVLPPYTMMRLLAHDVDIVGAAYRKRLPPYDLLGEQIDPKVATQREGLTEMARLPTGCLLIKNSVLMDFNFQRPWFREVYQEGTDWNSLGEDNYFCDRARELGYKVWCDVKLSMDIGHIGQQIVATGNDAAAPLSWRLDEVSETQRKEVA